MVPLAWFIGYHLGSATRLVIRPQWDPRHVQDLQQAIGIGSFLIYELVRSSEEPSLVPVLLRGCLGLNLHGRDLHCSDLCRLLCQTGNIIGLVTLLECRSCIGRTELEMDEDQEDSIFLAGRQADLRLGATSSD